ncbi:Signal transduction histidine-protein kinase BaeS [Gemella morbillorum]|uniref:sensor histidine kinase n=1 Tax=Gemella morbillorum TaxID=29391 RepID=UPI000DA39A29|nr:HAMP domain-containing sensor histidine kinase [Gemella morbillorum]UBH81114.1 HAMP domain-containing histidine kinase [Gemella morbillorum]SQH54874.1 Signal transduction histidine-protein kinase BaeS [Gemella morbillorum]
MLKKIKEIIFKPFRRITLTFKITLWYTIFIVILLTSIILGTFFVSDSVVESSGKKKLIEEVTEISNGKENFTAFEDGVTLSLYDKDGNLIAGSIPKNFDVRDFSLGVVTYYTDSNNNKYMYYDIETNSEKFANGKYVRGIVQISSGQTSWYLPFAIIAGSPIIILIITYGGYLIIRSSLKPVREMIETAETISNSADLSKRITIEDGKDEVHKLALVFNEMLESLERASMRERQFSSDVSHELRTPISVIVAESEYGTKYIDTVGEAKESFAVIKRQSKRMTTMINQILEMARLDNRLEIPKETFNLSSCLEKTLEDYKKLFVSKNIQLISNIEENITVFGNRVLLMRLIDNLISNALKHATSKTWISVVKRKSIIIEIKDDGKGIDDKEKEYIWDRFYKVDKSRSISEDNSSGLGLPISKKIVELHGGKIVALDNKPQGAKFVINL